MRELNFQELLGDQYPDACLHDGLVESIDLDYLTREVTLQCLLCVGDPQADPVSRETKARGRLLLTGLLYLSIEPPDESYAYEEGALDVTSDGPISEALQGGWRIPTLPRDMSEDAFVHCFYINNYNSYVCVAATGARFDWL